MKNEEIYALIYGEPKTGKTKNVLETWQKPLLLMNCDIGGYASCNSPMKFISSPELNEITEGKIPLEETIYVRDYSSMTVSVQIDQHREFHARPFQTLLMDLNTILKKCPFKTIVIDSLTCFSELQLEFIASLNSKKALEIQHWGQMAGKYWEVFSALAYIKAARVLIAHSTTEKDELTGAIRIIPLLYGQMKEKINAIPSQVFYSATTMGNDGKLKYVLHTQPFGLVKQVGCRFPQNLPAVVENNFSVIFKDLNSGK